MADKKTTVKTFAFKLRTNKSFVAACERTLDQARFVWNCALEQRITHYRQTGHSVGYCSQSRQLTEARTLPEVKACLRSIQQDALERLDDSFKAFFRRLKTGEAPGFPRFRGADRFNTFSQKYEPVRSCPLKGDKLTIPGVGSCRVRLSRPLEGTVKQLRITRKPTGWFALLVCELPLPAPLPKTGQSIGVDVGLKSCATLSTGEEIANPRHLRTAEDKLKHEQRRLSRKKKGSANRRKARRKVALRHLRVSDSRKDFHHKVAAHLVARCSRISVEALKVRGMLKNHHLAKSISDAGWSQFFTITKRQGSMRRT